MKARLACLLLALPLLLFSQKAARWPPGAARALVVGIARYQDTAFTASEAARREAEAFAAFLQTAPGGRMERGDILLLTDGGATLAQFVAALDWLLEEAPGLPPGRRVLYFSGAAQVTSPGGRREGAALFFHDSPPAPLEGNTFALLEIERLLRRSGRPFLLTAAFRGPFLEKKEGAAPPSPAVFWKKEGKQRGAFFLKKREAAPDGGPQPGRRPTLSDRFTAALIGQADRDGDRKVTPSEAARFLGNAGFGIRSSESPGSVDSAFRSPNSAFFYLAALPAAAPLSMVDERMLADLESLGGDALFPPIVHLESMPSEDRLLEKTAPETQRLYEDLILAIKVKHFVPPPDGGHAVALCDSLLGKIELAAIAGQLRRRLAAAMLDETQQALNAYLNNDAQELARRRRDPGQYATFARLMAEADRLLGERHYLHRQLTAKRLYFEGLHARLSFLAKKDSSMLAAALDRQRAALQAEPEAAYILNELGVVMLNLGQREGARRQFEEAIEHSPAWGIPYANLSLIHIAEGDLAAARELAIKATSLAPWSPAGYQLLGFICHESLELETAERLYLRAVRLGADGAELHYNLACLAALRSDPATALGRLGHALELGFDDRQKLATDTDLDPLRSLPEWRSLMEKHFPKD